MGPLFIMTHTVYKHHIVQTARRRLTGPSRSRYAPRHCQ